MTTPPLEHLLTQQTGAYREEAELVVRDAAAWSGAWRALHVGVPEAPPATDFARDMIVLVALGERPTGGFSVRVDAAEPEGTGAVVRYTATAPGAGCMTTQATTAPVDVVRARRVAGAVRFERREATQGC